MIDNKGDGGPSAVPLKQGTVEVWPPQTEPRDSAPSGCLASESECVLDSTYLPNHGDHGHRGHVHSRDE